MTSMTTVAADPESLDAAEDGDEQEEKTEGKPEEESGKINVPAEWSEAVVPPIVQRCDSVEEAREQNGSCGETLSCLSGTSLSCVCFLFLTSASFTP